MRLRTMLLALVGAVLGLGCLGAAIPQQQTNQAARPTPANQKSKESAAIPTRPPRHFVVFLRLGPNYVKGRPPQQQTGYAGHAEHVNQLAKEGTLVLGGPFVDDFSTMTTTGAMLILAVDTAEQARRIAEADPFLASGVLAIGEIRPLLIAAASWGPATAQTP